MTPLTVISTAVDWDTGRVCRSSVRSQRGGPWRHLWRSGDGAVWGTTPWDNNPVVSDCGKRNVTSIEGVIDMVTECEPDTVIVWLDGDDWLYSASALERIRREYDEHPDTWVTWGSYVMSSGARGSVCGRNWSRKSGWGCGHPKTFRAGLFHRIDREHLRYDDRWIDRCVDKLVMFSITEMAGKERCREISDVLYVYDYDRFGAKREADPVEHAREMAIERMIRSRPEYARLDRAPW